MRSYTAEWRKKHPERWRVMITASRRRRQIADRDTDRQRARDRYLRDRDRRLAQAAVQRERDRASGALGARQAVRVALRKGEITRPDSCQACSAPDMPLADGRTSLHAHHEDYARPLDIEWRCTVCHGLTRRIFA